MQQAHVSIRSIPVRRARFGAVALTLFLINSVACTEAEERGGEAMPQATETAQAAPNTLTEAERAAGWTLLFNGEDFSHWTGLGRDSVPEGHWVIEDGAIKKVDRDDVPAAEDGQPPAGGDLMTVETFEDFEFAFDWKVAPGANSGVKYNVSEAMSTLGGSSHAALGFEYQVIDDEGHASPLNPGQRTGALYDLIPAPETKALHPAGAWNHSRIVLQGRHGEHWLNGEKLLTFDLDAPRFDSLLAASKFAPIEGFADKRSGHLVLQDHGDVAWFRNLKIRELPPPEAPG